MKARRQSMSLPHDYTPDLGGIKAPTLLIHGRYDRMVTFEVSIAILNRMPIGTSCCSTLRHWPPFEKPAKWTAQILAFLRATALLGRLVMKRRVRPSQ